MRVRMRIVLSITVLAAVLVVISGVVDAADTEQAFRAGPATGYAHQTSDQVTIGAKPFSTPELTAEAFGKKTNLLRYGVLPVLVVIENKRGKTLSLENLEISLVGDDGRHVDQTKPEDLFEIGAKPGRKPPVINPLPIPHSSKRRPLDTPEIITRFFSARVLPPGDSASGFVYFQAKSEPGDKLYVSGIRETSSGREILYFEFEMNK